MVGQRTLNPLIGVRIPVRQQRRTSSNFIEMTEKEIKIKEEKFLRELNFFRNETESLVRYVYSSGALNDVIINNKSVRKSRK